MTVVVSNGYVSRLTDCLKNMNIKYDVENHRKLSHIFVSEKNKDITNIYDLLSVFIINNHIEKYVNSCIEKEFYFFDKKDKKLIFSNVLSHVDKNKITQMIKEFLSLKEWIMLDGFFAFRMRDFLLQLDEYIFEEADKLIYEKEISEFINLLKYFVSIGDGTCERVHVFLKNESYVLLDDSGNHLSKALDFMCEFSGMEYFPEDDLLGKLVTIAPKHIVIHDSDMQKNDEKLNIIYRVFEKSIEFCGGKCDKCREIYDIEKSKNM